VGTTLGGSTNLLTLDSSSGNKKFTFGASFVAVAVMFAAVIWWVIRRRPRYNRAP